MSVVTDAPVHPSSSDDFAAFLDGELDASSPSSSPDKEDENQDELESIRIKRRKVESIEETEGSTSEGIIKQNLEASVQVDAWKKHKDNLILMERYHFFASSCWQFNLNCQSLAQLKSDEDETDGVLAKILKLLKQVHCKFFDKRQDNLVDRDVRQVLSSVRSEVLSGCVIVFSRINHGALESLQKMAELLGATCVKETDYSVTHVVATDAGTEKARWAVKEKRFLVHPRWIEAANYFWEKQPEENFVLKKKQ